MSGISTATVAIAGAARFAVGGMGALGGALDEAPEKPEPGGGEGA